MFVSIFIILISAMLFIYWFRYTCLLILSTRSSKDYAMEVAEANNLHFLENRELLQRAGPAALAEISGSLDREFKMITYLARHVGSYAMPGDEMERLVLMADFWIMKVCFVLTRRIHPAQARRALLEITAIIQHFANSTGERVAFSARS